MGNKSTLKKPAKRKPRSTRKVAAAAPNRNLERDCNLALKIVDLENEFEAHDQSNEKCFYSLSARVETLEALANDYSDFCCGDGFPASHDPKPSKWKLAWRWLRLGA